jgi:hypothetical protein
MRYFIGCLLLFGSAVLHAQLHDYTWLIGYGGGPGTPTDDNFGLSELDFHGEELIIKEVEISEAEFYANNVSFSDADGKLVMYFDGMNVFGSNHHIADNGTNWFEGELEGGWYQAQSSLALPSSLEPDCVHFINIEQNLLSIPPDTLDVFGEKLYYSCVVKNENELTVVIRKQLLLHDTLTLGKLTVCRHGNGRDWWLLVPELYGWKVFRFLITPEGIEQYSALLLDKWLADGLGQAKFSSNGAHYMRYNGISSTAGEWVTIWDFDRCTGQLSNRQQGNFPIGGSSGGAAISKNSRYLYTASNTLLYQYDLQAEEVLSTRTVIAEYDGNLDPLPTTFYQMQLAPDGKIYISSPGSVFSLHVIHNPDAICPDCRIEQHSIELPFYNYTSIPNQPNYRLGPIDGSPCDTLGIDNLPLSRWRYEQDTLTPFTVQFYDLSDYEPATWSWDFGEGSSSTDTLPAHTFPGPGTYEVCLTVSNANGSDTKCKTLEFTEPVTATEQAETAPLATAFPNPFRERFSLSLRAGWLPVQADAVVYDAMGRPVLTQRLSAGFNTLDLSGHPAGVYTWRLEEQGRILEVGKVVKIGNR